jgi:hypothetical protein
MALSIACPGCDADYSVPENLVGKTIRCSLRRIDPGESVESESRGPAQPR